MNPPDHSGMVGAAVLRAKKMVGADFGGLEPNCGVAARQDVLLDAEDRDKEVVNHVFGSHSELHRHAHWDMQFIDLARPFSVLQVPHPLLADDKNLHGGVGWPGILEIEAGSPDEQYGADKRGGDRPGQL